MRTYKALSVAAPLGDFIAQAKKTIEVRDFVTSDLLPSEDLLIVQTKNPLTDKSPEDPYARAVCLVRVKEMRKFLYSDRAEAKTERFHESWFAWVLTDVRPLQKKTRALAAQGLYQVQIEELA